MATTLVPGPSTTATTRPRALTGGLWVLQAVLALQLAGGGTLKIIGDPAMVDLFAQIGAGQWFRYVVGALEIAGAIGLLAPRLVALAAFCVALLMAGAAVTNVLVLHESPVLPLVLLVLAAAVAWMRRPAPSVEV